MTFNKTKPNLAADLREEIIAHIEQNPDIFKFDDSSEEWLNNQIEIGLDRGFSYIETYEQLAKMFNISKHNKVRESA